MATSTTARWAIAALLCLAAVTLVAADSTEDMTERLDNLDFMEFTALTGAVEGQRSLLQASAAAPAYSPSPSPRPRPCPLGNRPNSNTYTITMTGRANWGYGRDLLVRSTNAVYRSAKYNFPNLRITVTAGPTNIFRRRPRQSTWSYRVVVPVPRCTVKKESLRNALRNALKNSTRGSRLITSITFA